MELRVRCVKVKERWGLEQKGKILPFYVLGGLHFGAAFKTKEAADRCKSELKIRAKTVRLK